MKPEHRETIEAVVGALEYAYDYEEPYGAGRHYALELTSEQLQDLIRCLKAALQETE